jgi:hypothetical protein
MTIMTALLFGAVPAALVVLAGMLVVHNSPQGAADRRLFLFLLAVETALLLTVVVTASIPSGPDNPIISQTPVILATVTLGTLALTLTRLKDLASLSRPQKALAALLGVATLGLAAAGLQAGWTFPFLGGAVLLAGVWVLGYRSDVRAGILILLALAGMAVINSDSFYARTFQFPDALSTFIGIAAFFTPVVAIVDAAVLISTTLNLFRRPAAPDGASGLAGLAGPAGAGVTRQTWILAGLHIALAAGLLAWLADTIRWAALWDQTSDGLNESFLTVEAVLAAIVAGMFLGMRFSGWRRASGLAYAVLVSAVMLLASNQEWGAYQPITTARAAAIQAALERYHARTGQYPAALEGLAPGELLSVPGPVILRGQGWCYQGGPDYYRLGAVYRDSFSSPLSVKVYASVGSPPVGWDCEARLVQLKAAYEARPPYSSYGVAPTETPLPASPIPIPPIAVIPRLAAANIQPGTWSPDGSTLLLGLLDNSQGQLQFVLSFLNAKDGTLCQAGQQSPVNQPIPASFSLGEHAAWLPDGRLLFLSPAGNLALLRPCQGDSESLSGRYPQVFDRMVAASLKSGRILLQSKASFWILDGTSLALRPVLDVSPNPYAPQSDQGAWSLDGSRLAISRLNGQDPQGGQGGQGGQSGQSGATLYLVDGASGIVLQSLPVPGSSGQSAPRVAWLDGHELLLSGAGSPALVDIQANPARIKDVLKDIFALDVTAAHLSTVASLPDPGGQSYHLVVRVDDPRSQAVYLYHAETGAVEILHPAANQVLLFPDGSWIETAPLTVPAPSPEGLCSNSSVKCGGTPAFNGKNNTQSPETIQLDWVDAPGKAALQLPVQGHSPRNDHFLGAKYLPGSSQMIFSSSQGISLVALPGGELLKFWTLAERNTNGTPSVQVSPDGRTLAAFLGSTGLYYIPLTH